jgi:glycyl-tRNA synthetase alpha subunit
MTPEQAQEQLKVLDDDFALLLHERMLHASHALLATTEARTSSLEDRDEWLQTIAEVSRLTAVLAHQEARIAILSQVEGIDEAQDEAAQ